MVRYGRRSCCGLAFMIAGESIARMLPEMRSRGGIMSIRTAQDKRKMRMRGAARRPLRMSVRVGGMLQQVVLPKFEGVGGSFRSLPGTCFARVCHAERVSPNLHSCKTIPGDGRFDLDRRGAPQKCGGAIISPPAVPAPRGRFAFK